MDKDDYHKMIELINSGLSQDEVLDKIVDYRRQKESSKEAETSLEEMIDDFLEEAEKENECFERAKRIYDELENKDNFETIKEAYNHITQFYKDELSGFDNFTINRMVVEMHYSQFNDFSRDAILACAINYSDLDKLMIKVGFLDNYLGYKLGENGHKKKIIVLGDCNQFVGNKMVDGEIYVLGNVGNDCGRKMYGGKILVEGDAQDNCGYFMYDGEIQIEGDVGDWCGRGMSDGEIKVDGKISGDIGKYKTGGRIINKGKVY